MLPEFSYFDWQLDEGGDSSGPSNPNDSNRKLCLVENVTELSALIEHLSSIREIGVDVYDRNISPSSPNESPAIIQISTRDTDFLVDAIALRDSVQLLLSIFGNPRQVKVLHNCASTATALYQYWGLCFVNCFDTLLAAKLLKYPDSSLAHLANYFCDKIIVTKQSVDNAKLKQILVSLRTRPLSNDVLSLAREQSQYLLRLHDGLRAELRSALGREGVIAVLEATKKTCALNYPEKSLPSSAPYNVLLSSQSYVDQQHYQQQHHQNSLQFASTYATFTPTLSTPATLLTTYVNESHNPMLARSPVMSPEEIYSMAGWNTPLPPQDHDQDLFNRNSGSLITDNAWGHRPNADLGVSSSNVGEEQTSVQTLSRQGESVFGGIGTTGTVLREVPASFEEIYELSNRNRRRTKDRRRGREGEQDGHEDATNEEIEIPTSSISSATGGTYNQTGSGKTSASTFDDSIYFNVQPAKNDPNDDLTTSTLAFAQSLGWIDNSTPLSRILPHQQPPSVRNSYDFDGNSTDLGGLAKAQQPPSVRNSYDFDGTGGGLVGLGRTQQQPSARNSYDFDGTGGGLSGLGKAQQSSSVHNSYDLDGTGGGLGGLGKTQQPPSVHNSYDLDGTGGGFGGLGSHLAGAMYDDGVDYHTGDSQSHSQGHNQAQVQRPRHHQQQMQGNQYQQQSHQQVRQQGFEYSRVSAAVSQGMSADAGMNANSSHTSHHRDRDNKQTQQHSGGRTSGRNPYIKGGGKKS